MVEKNNDSKESSFVKVRNSTNVCVRGNSTIGYDNVVDAENCDNVEATHNLSLRQPMDNRPPSRSKEWYKKPIGILILSVAGIVLASIVLAILHHYFPSLKP